MSKKNAVELLKSHRFIYAVFLVVLVVVFFLFVSTSSELKTVLEEQETLFQERENAYLDEQEAVIIKIEKETVLVPVQPVLFKYVEVVDSCGPRFEEDCLNARSGPGTDFDVVNRFRNGVVLKVGGMVERDGITWYKIVFDEWIRYPERIDGDMYVAADYVRELFDEGQRDITLLGEASEENNKRIVVSRSEQTLRAYDGDELFMEELISTGVELTPTPRGEFTIFRKTPSRYMQGPLPGISTQYWDLPGVPWNLYFTHQGAVIHGTYWHDNFGNPHSNGCVNIEPSKAEKLYKWADLGTKVVVVD